MAQSVHEAFHNMALMSPQTDPSDVDQHTRVFREALKELVDSLLLLPFWF